ncbi:MAG: chromosomal replication initiator protein DnaA [Xanthobacteraceae bacterium]|nr:chromosomal replication initiator protein DnaA [Xanthobacteraceae bacterium]
METTVDAETWTRLRSILRARVGEEVYASWFIRLEFERCADGIVVLSVPTRFLKVWIAQHYEAVLTEIWQTVDADVRLVINVRQAKLNPPSRPTRPVPLSMPAPPLAPAAPPVHAEDAPLSSPLDPRLTFDAFRLGDSNRLAHAAAKRVAGGPIISDPVFNPLFIHGGVGLGKTHLLQAVAAAGEASGRRVLYLTAERFMFGFVAALRSQSAPVFQEALRAADILIIDDVQFLQGKSVLQEFAYTLNTVIACRRQVVLAADRSPAEFDAMDERARSRMAGGLVVEIAPLEEELKLDILTSRLSVLARQYPGFSVEPDILGYVARHCGHTGRDLNGALNRLLAHNQLTGREITPEVAESALRDLIRTAEPKRIRIDDIMRAVTKRYSVSRADILSQRRTANVVKPRQIAMYLAKTLTLRSLPEIGRRFGGRDHTTVLHAVRKIDGLVTSGADVAAEVKALEAMLQEEAA